MRYFRKYYLLKLKQILPLRSKKAWLSESLVRHHTLPAFLNLNARPYHDFQTRLQTCSFELICSEYIQVSEPTGVSWDDYPDLKETFLRKNAYFAAVYSIAWYSNYNSGYHLIKLVDDNWVLVKWLEVGGSVLIHNFTGTTCCPDRSSLKVSKRLQVYFTIFIKLTNSSSEKSDGNHISETTPQSLSLISKILKIPFTFLFLMKTNFE